MIKTDKRIFHANLFFLTKIIIVREGVLKS